MDERSSFRLFAAVLALAAVFPLFVGLWHGLDRPYFTVSDADIIYTGEALRALDGKPHFYTDHPAYIYALALAGWLKALSFAGLIPSPGLAAAVAAPDIDAYAQAMVWGGRLFSGLLAGLFVLAAGVLLRVGGVSRLAAGMFAWGLACSGGVAVQAVIMRAELMSAGFLFISFAALRVAARRAGWAGPAWLAAAGFLALLAYETKVQAFIPLLAFPVLALGLESIQGRRPPWGDDWRVMPAILLAAALVLPVLVLVRFSIRDFDFGPPVGPYQAASLVWIAVGAAAFARLNRVPARVALLGLAGLGLGMALGFDLLFLRHAPRVVDALVNPIEHMRVFAGGLGTGQGPLQILAGSLSAMAAPMPHLLPLRVMELAGLAGALLSWRGGERRAAILSILLIGMALAVELGFGLRGVFASYLVYLEPWALLALLAPVQGLAGRSAWEKRVLAVAAAIFLAWTGARALDSGLVAPQPLANLCYQADTYIEAELAVRFRPTCAAIP